MKQLTLPLWWLAATILPSALGCAPSYHAYQDCYVDCAYCPPPPLPFRQYAACGCRWRAVESYWQGRSADDQLSEGVVTFAPQVGRHHKSPATVDIQRISFPNKTNSPIPGT